MLSHLIGCCSSRCIHEADSIKGGYVPGLPAAVAAATSALLTLSTTTNVGRAAVTITPNLAAVSLLLAARVVALSEAEQADENDHNNGNDGWGGVLLSLTATDGGEPNLVGCLPGRGGRVDPK